MQEEADEICVNLFEEVVLWGAVSKPSQVPKQGEGGSSDCWPFLETRFPSQYLY